MVITDYLGVSSSKGNNSLSKSIVSAVAIGLLATGLYFSSRDMSKGYDLRTSIPRIKQNYGFSQVPINLNSTDLSFIDPSLDSNSGLEGLLKK